VNAADAKKAAATELPCSDFGDGCLSDLRLPICDFPTHFCRLHHSLAAFTVWSRKLLKDFPAPYHAQDPRRDLRRPLRPAGCAFSLGLCSPEML
jgi:hypothetical protein